MTDTSPQLREGFSVDQQLALRTAATRLAAEFAEVRPIRDEIARRVRRLLDALHVPATRQTTQADTRPATSLQWERTDR
ncbi:hypothetical protein [Micromonospora coerulea]|uniref:hypothetical protein n=1 Tax=Micromonospora coerulea TaxID=47856 RepID=UPI001904B174|nr:hypothetical protein [Micromonospora veneta]